MAHVEKRGAGRWRARYRGPDGRERSQTFDRKSDAERWLAGVEVSKARGEWLDPALGRKTFAAWVSEWSSTTVDLRPSTRARDESYTRNHLLPHFGPAPVGKITSTDVRAFVAAMQGDGRHSPATVRKVGQILAKIMAGAVDAGLIARSPSAGVALPVEPKRDMRFLDSTEVARLADTIGPHHVPLVYTAVYAGLRWGELAGLRPDRVNVLGRSIQVVEQLTEVNGQLEYGPPKSAAGRRSVKIPGFLAEMLGARIGEPVVSSSGLVFPSPEGQAMRRSNFRRRPWLPAVRDAALEGLRFHDLRHTAVALAIAQGAHPKAIQERMGHSSIQVTLDRYGHLFPGLDERIADGLDEVYRQSLAASPRPERGLAVVELAR
ncbi:MAG: site-specific integrase [Acidimicrobiia bacterium]|nr:site-specific integrase [Acidimicrobiia bacterium]